MVRFWISWKRTLCQAWLADIFEVVKRKGLTNLKTEEVIFVIEFKVNLAKCDLLISFSMAIESAAAPDSWHMCQQSSLSHSKRGGNLSNHTSQNMHLKLQHNSKIIFWYFQRYKSCKKSVSAANPVLSRSTVWIICHICSPYFGQFLL